MLRPERMSKVSVTGSRSVMGEVVETVYDLHRLHLTDYDGSWEGFDNGNPMSGADDASEKLVTVRGLESTLDLDEDEDASSGYEFDPSELEDRLAAVREEVTELDDRRGELRQELREVEDRISSMRPFARLGIDLDLLSGYDHVEVVVGEGEEADVRAAYEAADGVRAVETFSGDGVVAAVVAPAEGVDPDDAATDPLVGVEFAEIEVPEADGSAEDYVEELRHEAQRLEKRLDEVEAELENVTLDVAGFLLAAEEYLSIRVQKAEAPLQFATTTNSFVAEGWIPTPEVDEFEAALRDAVGDRVEFEELERASYSGHGHAAHHEEVGGGGPPEDSEDAAPAESAEEDDPQRAVADGGVARSGGVVTVPDDPPVVQTNPGPAKAFERLTNMFGTPNYSEFDPTIVFFLTFPLMFGFMIGDVAYGLIYAGIGYYLYTGFDSEAFRDVGVVALLAGVFTVVFGLLYGEAFGLHMFGGNFLDVEGLPLMHKGIQPAEAHWARFWFLVTILFGALHLGLGYVFEFVEGFRLHGIKDATTEAGSWLLMLVGLWLFIFSDLLKAQTYDASQSVQFGETVDASQNIPLFIFWIVDDGPLAILNLGFDGFPTTVGYVGAAMFGIGLVLIVAGPWYEIVEFHVPLAHTLSYLRISAVLLAKAGMAFAANVLYFGAYQTHGEYHFMIAHGPDYVRSHYGADAIIFTGMYNSGFGIALIGLVVLLVGQLVVLLLGITSAGIQGIRLEYYEFFTKFYEGNGRAYTPFGQERRFTRDE